MEKVYADVPQFIPLSNDLMFKYIFGYQKNARFIIDLLEEFFDVEKGKFKNSKILNSVKLDKNSLSDKGFELDVLVELPNKKRVIVEMYTSYNVSSEIKSLMYLASKFSNQMSSGEKYKDINSVIILNLVKNNKIHNTDFVRKYTLINEEDKYDMVLPDYFRFYIVDVDNVNKNNYNISVRFKKWTDFINATSEKEILKIIKNDKIMEEAYDQMKSFRKNEYWGNGFFHPSKLIKEQAEDEGFEKGMEKGMEKGVIETAKKMLLLDLDVDTISKATGLPMEKIEQLKNSN